MNDTQQLVIFEGEAGQVEVRLEGETVWLSLQQLADLFGRDKSVISRHLKGIFSTGELPREGTVAKNATVQLEGTREVVRHIEYYNLDAIISVGYRVNSTRATHFRQWATRILKEHLTQGYTLNRQRFEQNAAELEAALTLVKKAAAGDALTTDQGRGLVDVIARYTHTFLWLQRYDEGLLTEPLGSPGGTLPSADEARSGIARLKADLMAHEEATALFGNEREGGLAALALLVAESNPKSKEVMIRLIENMLAPSQVRTSA